MTAQPLGDRARKQYEQSEKQASTTMEELVSSQGFSEGLALFTSNAVAISRVVTTGLDQLVRVSRLAGRRDIARLGRQIARTEDKLEQVLQAVEQLEAQVGAQVETDESASAPTGGRAPRSQASRSPRSPRSGRARTASAALDEGEGGAR